MNKLTLIDTHCHIHEDDYPDVLDDLNKSKSHGIISFICVGTDLESSKKAVAFAKKYKNYGAYASIGIHPHEATPEKIDLNLSKKVWEELEKLAKEPEVVAIGEFGFDFFYHKKEDAKLNQTELAKKHLELANKLNLPLILHIREAFEPFVKLIKAYPKLKGVVHSFSDTDSKLKKVLDLPNNFYIGLNGIMTFSKDSKQLKAAKDVPLDRLVLETDSPYLTPAPLRGKINSINNTPLIAEFLSDLREEKLEDLSAATTANSKRLFSI